MFLVPSHDIFPAKDWFVVTSLFSYKYHDHLIFACNCWTSCCTKESTNNLAERPRIQPPPGWCGLVPLFLCILFDQCLIYGEVIIFLIWGKDLPTIYDPATILGKIYTLKNNEELRLTILSSEITSSKEILNKNLWFRHYAVDVSDSHFDNQTECIPYVNKFCRGNNERNPTDSIGYKRTIIQVYWGELKLLVFPFINNS